MRALLQFHFEGQGQDLGEGHDTHAGCGGESDGGVRQHEFSQHLAAGAAGRARGVIQVGDRYGGDADIGPKFGDGAYKGGAFGAEGQAVAHILDVGSSDDGPVGEAKSRANLEAGVW